MHAAYVGATGVMAAREGLSRTATNLANQQSTAFKKERSVFTTLLYTTEAHGEIALNRAGLPSRPTPIQKGAGAYVGGMTRDFTVGQPRETKRPYDIYIEGRGFVQVIYDENTDRRAYTRMGHLDRDNQGRLVTNTGYVLSDNIIVPEDALAIMITREGLVQAKMPNQIAPQELGQITLHTFINPGGLEAAADTLFFETESSGVSIQGNPNEDQFGRLLQGYVEMSNVNPILELVLAVDYSQWSTACADAIKIAQETQKTDIQQITAI